MNRADPKGRKHPRQFCRTGRRNDTGATPTKIKPYRILLFAPDPTLGGGVAEFDAVFRKRAGPRLDVIPFVIGRRPRNRSRLLRLIAPIIDSVRLIEYAARNDIDVFHLNPSLNLRSILRDGFFLIILKCFRREKILVFFRGWNDETYLSIRQSKIKRSLFQRVFGSASRILVLASSFRLALIELGIDLHKIFITTTMFDGELLQNAGRIKSDQYLHFLFLGRFVHTKGIYDLLQAFKKARTRVRNIKLTLAGTGPEELRIREWVTTHSLQDDIDFPGYVIGRDKANLLLESDVFVLPSFHGEGCPNALLEAMGAGLPVIVTAAGGVPDIVSHKRNGFIVPKRDKDALADAIISLAKYEDLRSRFGRTNKTQAWQNYEASIVLSQFEEHYRSIVSPSSDTETARE